MFSEIWLKRAQDGAVFAPAPVNFSSRYYSDIDLQKSDHIYEMKKPGTAIFNFDYQVSGVGTAACGPNLTIKYQVAVKPLHFSFLMMVE